MVEDESIRRERLQSLSKTVEINPENMTVENGAITGFDNIADHSIQENDSKNDKHTFSGRENRSDTGIDNVAYESAETTAQTRL